MGHKDLKSIERYLAALHHKGVQSAVESSSIAAMIA